MRPVTLCFKDRQLTSNLPSSSTESATKRRSFGVWLGHSDGGSIQSADRGARRTLLEQPTSPETGLGHRFDSCLSSCHGISIDLGLRGDPMSYEQTVSHHATSAPAR